MTQDVVEMVERYLSEDPAQWAKLASDIQYRRLHLLLLREILIELRKLTTSAAAADTVSPLPGALSR